MTGGDPGDEPLDILPIDAGRDAPRSAEPRGDRGSKARPLLVVIAVAVIAIAGFNLLAGTDATPPENAADDAPAGSFDLDNFEAPPDAELSGLIDGQTVRYELDELPFSVDTVTVTCLREPSGEVESVLDECDSGTAQRHTTSPGGVVEAAVTVHRQIAIGGFRRIDCAEQACELRTYAAEASGVVVGRALLDWAVAPAERQAAQITVETEGRLVEGDELTVVGSGFPGETTIHLRPCWLGVDPDPFACEWILADETVQTEPDGTFRHTVVADWEIGFGVDAIRCADVPEGLCAMTVSVPGAERQPAAVPLTIQRARAQRAPLPEALTISATDGLVDGQTVAITVDGDRTGDFGLFLCVEVDAPLDCTWLDLGRAVTDGDYEIPRAFVSWRGIRHDCLVDGDCVVSLFSFADSEERLDVPITFDPDVELRAPSPVTVSPTNELAEQALLTLEFDSLISVPIVSICAEGDARTCENLPTEYLTGAELITRVRPSLVTPEGPHNCLLDGPCELIVWDAATLTRYATTPLEFAPVEQRPISGVLRPSGPLVHGQTAQIAVSDAIDEVSVSICAVDGGCIALLVTDTIDGRSLIEFTGMRSFTLRFDDGTHQRLDCAVDACELRVSDGWAIDRIPLAFTGAPAPDKAIAIAAAEPLPLDEAITVRGRGFTPTVQRSEISLELCPPSVDVESACIRVGLVSTDNGLAADGTFEASIDIPSNAFTNGFQARADRCEVECELVARPRYGDPVRLPVLRDINPP